MLSFGEEAFEELVAVSDAEGLCRRLLASPWGWGSITRYAEAVELLGKVQGTSALPMSFVALMLCTCRRWDRVTSRLIAAIEDSGLLSFGVPRTLPYPLMARSTLRTDATRLSRGGWIAAAANNP